MRTINISEETYEAIKGQLTEGEKLDFNSLQDLVGKSWFFRTVTYHIIGKVVKICGQFAILETASWVADSGRFMQAIKEGKLDEVEPIGGMMLNIQTTTDIIPWIHKLPTEQK